MKIYLIETEKAYNTYFGITKVNKDELINQTRLFIESLSNNNYNPRQWVLKNAVASISHKKWEQAMIDFQHLSGWSLF